MIFGKNKKGNVWVEALTVIIIIVVFDMLNIFANYVGDEINTDFQSDDSHSTEAKDTMQQLQSNHSNLMDNMLLMAFVLLVIFVIVAAYFVDSHPIFFVITLIILIFVLVVAAMLANVYDDVMLDDTISSTANKFTYTSWILGNLLPIGIAIVFILIVVIFIKFRG